MTALVCAAAGIFILLLGVVWFRDRRELKQSEVLRHAAEERLQHLQLQFERFAPAQVVDQLVDSTGAFAPERRQLTILFADLRGFTALCDQLDPAVTVDILNGYFRGMCEVIARHHGHVNQLIGDGMIALFGAFEPNPWQARDAVMAALDMRAELARYNETLHARGLPRLRFGVGIHCGEVVAGVMGAGGLFKFDVSGDTVNVASRVEGLTGQLQVDVLITAAVREAVGDRFRLREMPPATVKGKAEALSTWHVESAV